VAELVLARALVSVVLSWLLLRQAGVFPWGQRRGLLVIRGLVGSLALLCVYLAITRLPLASSTVLQYLYPSITALLAWPWLGERLRRRSLLGLALGWLGVLLVCQPAGGMGLGLQLFPGASPLPLEGTLAALAGALLTALAYVSVRDLGRSEHPLVIVFYFPLVSVPFSLPLVLLQPVWPAPRTGSGSWESGCSPNSDSWASPSASPGSRPPGPPRSATCR
jgi:drug/metabolite transporter (DMT)-like permease